ncbi:MAG: hypothetical protein A3J93_00945 [Candidatus Magasanikbacteria bacterium RIFOXYC2_FULL_42_28]|uniref:Glycosyltransferase 2-like domain-containing protein n=1 Tax=Candidatus Magasanikbacteria bacterium RIFOXYC2_FULL_42_28 TaxID=1798704 RepID=A0A1F6NXL3_9BACT|nr:MAG: hypothetical protein A3J93_00945 [Candidatus Magasanikbacteria bacterium RIFOXYC2_FULL_42_28]
MPKLTISLVVHNGENYIQFIISSLKLQTFKDWELIIIDNASTDQTVELLELGLKDSGITYRIIRNSENFGFAVGHNQAFAEVKTPYFLLLNADMYLMPDVLERMTAFMDMHQDAGAVAPRLMRWDFERARLAFNGNLLNNFEVAQTGFTSQIDAIGVRLFRNRRAVEWQTRQTWATDSESKAVREMYGLPILEVFGVSGALAMLRKSLIDKILLPGNNLFDPTYHSYKEDLDLAYRLRNAGFVSYVLLDAVAYHDRTGAGPKEMGDYAALKNKTNQPYFVSYHSYKNHLRTLYKNEYWENILRDFPFIFWYEFKKFIYLLFTNPKVVINGWGDIIRNWKYTKEARHAVVSSRHLHWQGIRRWFL